MPPYILLNNQELKSVIIDLLIVCPQSSTNSVKAILLSSKYCIDFLCVSIDIVVSLLPWAIYISFSLLSTVREDADGI